MKSFLFTLASLMMIGTAYAEDICTISDIEVPQTEIGHEIEIPIAAHLDHYCSSFRLMFEFPEGVTCTGLVAGDDLELVYLNEEGEETHSMPTVSVNPQNTTVLAFHMFQAYDEDQNFVGVAHWAPGDYDEFLRMFIRVDENFQGGEILIATEFTAGGLANVPQDEMCPRNSHWEYTCNVTVVEPTSQDIFHMDSTNVFRGETVIIPVQMINEESVIAFETDIVLPDGFSIVTDEDDEPVILPSSRLTSDHMLMAEQLNDGRIHVICYTPSSKVINGNEGDVFYFEVAVPEDAGGDYIIYLRNSLLTNSDYAEFSIPDAKACLHVYPYIPGDVNNSHTVTVTDIVFTAQYILQRNPSPFVFDAADMNGDGNISVTDIMLIANLIMPSTVNVSKCMVTLSETCDRMSASDISIAMGETRTVSIELDNEMIYSAFQLDLHLPNGLIANNFQLTDRAGSHILDVETISDGTIRALCYSNTKTNISCHEGALLTFDVTAVMPTIGNITADGIELVTNALQTEKLDTFTIGVNNTTSANELATGKSISRMDYFNMAGQQIDRIESGVTFVVTTYSDGTRSVSKVVMK